jgi:hypothetical protein
MTTKSLSVALFLFYLENLQQRFLGSMRKTNHHGNETVHASSENLSTQKEHQTTSFIIANAGETGRVSIQLLSPMSGENCFQTIRASRFAV